MAFENQGAETSEKHFRNSPDINPTYNKEKRIDSGRPGFNSNANITVWIHLALWRSEQTNVSTALIVTHPLGSRAHWPAPPCCVMPQTPHKQVNANSNACCIPRKSAAPVSGHKMCSMEKKLIKGNHRSMTVPLSSTESFWFRSETKTAWLALPSLVLNRQTLHTLTQL